MSKIAEFGQKTQGILGIKIYKCIGLYVFTLLNEPMNLDIYIRVMV
jgi:hypothetical protein